jgi:hypothetical protein
MAAVLDLETDICRAPADQAVAIHSHNRSRLAVRNPIFSGAGASYRHARD